jgi:Nuclease-related domain/UvrD-like helicase C-terminal domain
LNILLRTGKNASEQGDKAMARIIPQNTGADIVSVAERWFLDAAIQFLDDEFIAFHSVPWVHVASQQLRQGEWDFLILHPYLGFFSIETKPGDIRYEAGSGLWSRADGQHLKSDPYLQAQKSAHAVSQFFTQKIKVDEATEGDVDGKIRYATIFRFKGLEADCVIVIGFTRNDEGEASPMLYCAVSRAKFMLFVVYRTDT